MGAAASGSLCLGGRLGNRRVDAFGRATLTGSFGVIPMLIDWITARAAMEHFPRESWDELRLYSDRIVRFCPRTGDVVYESCAWDSIRSDSHQIAFRVGADAVWIQGSPARVFGSGDAVFGEGASSALDLAGCVVRMAGFAAGQIGVAFPLDPQAWDVSRVDVTENILLDDLPAVRIALRVLRECEGGRYRVSQQAGDTVYWSHHSRLRSGKAYAKGPHLRYLLGKGDYSGRPYTEVEVGAAERLLRLELKLGAQWWRRRAGRDGSPGPWTWRTTEARTAGNPEWYDITPDQLKSEWNEYFERMVGDVEMNESTDIKARIVAAAGSEGQGRAAYGCWLLIEREGWESARECFSKRTWYRHLKVFHVAGLGDADISAGRVVPFRQKMAVGSRVSSWGELMQLQKAA